MNSFFSADMYKSGWALCTTEYTEKESEDMRVLFFSLGAKAIVLSPSPKSHD